MQHGFLDIPTFHYFEEGNTWAGSVYTNFNYRIAPKKAKKDTDEKSELKAAVWYGTKCFDQAEELIAQFSEDYSEAGLDACIEKLISEFERFKEIRKDLTFD